MMKLRSFLSITIVMLMLGSLTACSSTPNSESTGEFFDNSVITARIKARLIDDPLTSGFRIKVNTYKGVVQLSGFVNTHEEKQRAYDLAAEVPGVSTIRNDIVVSH